MFYEELGRQCQQAEEFAPRKHNSLQLILGQAAKGGQMPAAIHGFYYSTATINRLK